MLLVLRIRHDIILHYTLLRIYQEIYRNKIFGFKAMRVRISVKDPTWRNTNNIVDIRYNDLVDIHPLFSRPFQFYNWHQHLTRTTASGLSIQVHTYFTSGALGCKKNWVAMHSRNMIPLINFVVARMKEKKSKPSLLREPKIVWSRLSAVYNLLIVEYPEKPNRNFRFGFSALICSGRAVY